MSAVVSRSKGGTVVHVRLGACTFALTRLEAELLDMTRRAGGGMFLTEAQARRAAKLVSLGFGRLEGGTFCGEERPRRDPPPVDGMRYFELDDLAVGWSR